MVVIESNAVNVKSRRLKSNTTVKKNAEKAANERRTRILATMRHMYRDDVFSTERAVQVLRKPA